jgi:hypothetical protein
MNDVARGGRTGLWVQIVAGILVAASSASCALEPLGDEHVRSVIEPMLAACPTARADDEAARDTCSERLGALEGLREAMAEPFLWGGQGATAERALEDSHTTRFNPFVWRRMYLSLMMFPGDYTIEHDGDRIVARVPYELRQLDAGAYPYPFWHKKEKWQSYQLATEILFFFEEGKLVGALRSKEQDPARPVVERAWDGQFRWVDAVGQEQPYVTLYTYLLSPSNPHVAELDAAYRSFESTSRKHSCTSCHDPSNSADMNPLELFSFPNQALASRHVIIEALEKNRMPIGEDAPTSIGIANEADRKELIELAKQFQRVGDLALAYEGEKR